MNIELWFARTGIIAAVFILCANTHFGFSVAYNYLRVWRRGGFNDISSNAFIALTVSAIIDLLMLAIMDVGQAMMILTEGWAGVVGLLSTILGFAFGYKASTKLTNKRGNFEAVLTETSTERRPVSSPPPTP